MLLGLRILTIGVFFMPVLNYAQVQVNEDANVQKVVGWYKNLKANQSKIDGWSVQIISTRDRRKMEETKSMFQLRYPQYAIDTDYLEPLYRLRVGSFMNKLDALSLRNDLRSQFRSALLIKQEFTKSDFY